MVSGVSIDKSLIDSIWIIRKRISNVDAPMGPRENVSDRYLMIIMFRLKIRKNSLRIIREGLQVDVKVET